MLGAGWSDKLLPIIDQLCQANASEGGRPIVVLAERDKEAMEEDLAKHGINEYGSRVIFRYGCMLHRPFVWLIACLMLPSTSDKQKQRCIAVLQCVARCPHGQLGCWGN